MAQMTKRVLDMTDAKTSIYDLPDDTLRVIFQWLDNDSGSDAMYTTVQFVGKVGRCKEYNITKSTLAQLVRMITPNFYHGALLYNGNVWLPSLVCKRFQAISEELRRGWYHTPTYINETSWSVVKVIVHNLFGPGQHCLYSFTSFVDFSYHGEWLNDVSLYVGPEKGHVQIMSNLHAEVECGKLSFNKAYFAVYHAVRRYLLTRNVQNMTLDSKLSYRQAQSSVYEFATRGFDNKPDWS